MTCAPPTSFLLFGPQARRPGSKPKTRPICSSSFLWGEVFQKVRENKIKLEPVKLSGREQIREACAARFAEVEGGYVEGFWGGREDFKLPAFIAQMIDSLTELSGVYNTLAKKLDKAENLEEISNTFRYTDKMVEKAVSFIIENSVLPRIDSLQRVVH